MSIPNGGSFYVTNVTTDTTVRNRYQIMQTLQRFQTIQLTLAAVTKRYNPTVTLQPVQPLQTLQPTKNAILQRHTANNMQPPQLPQQPLQPPPTQARPGNQPTRPGDIFHIYSLHSGRDPEFHIPATAAKGNK